MKKFARILVFALVAVSLLAVCAVAMGEDITCYIPNRVTRLQLPDYEEAQYDECTFDGDPFRTGAEGAKTTVYWEQVTVEGDHYVYQYTPAGKKVKVNLRGTIDEDGNVRHYYYDTLYISRVRTEYPKGNYIRRIVANYRNDAARTLVDYLITYQVSDTEKYTIRYAAADATILETHSYTYNLTTGKKITTGIKFSKWNGTPRADKLASNQFLHRYYQDQILEGWYRADGEQELKSGSGKNFKKWYRWEYWSGKVVQVYKAGLKPVTAFPSPRAE